ncbi:MAG TPA: YppG family protein [Bacillota bacterium]|nr:YppG family protein [Bacillota bacterium]
MENFHMKENHQPFLRQNTDTIGGQHYYYDANHHPVEGSTIFDQETAPPNPYSPTGQPVISPYEMYAKPPQPEGWSGQLNDGYFQMPEKKSNSIMAHFYDENGQMDLQKMLSTVNQLANTFQQVTPVIQQLGSLVRFIR